MGCLLSRYRRRLQHKVQEEANKYWSQQQSDAQIRIEVEFNQGEGNLELLQTQEEKKQPLYSRCFKRKNKESQKTMCMELLNQPLLKGSQSQTTVNENRMKSEKQSQMKKKEQTNTKIEEQQQSITITIEENNEQNIRDDKLLEQNFSQFVRQQEQQDQPKQMIQQSIASNIDHMWLERILKIKTCEQKIMDQYVDFVPLNIDLTFEFVIYEIIYPFLTSLQSSEYKKFTWLVTIFYNLCQVEINKNSVWVLEGEIKYSKYKKLLDCILEYMITAVLYPESLEWSIQWENPDNFYDFHNKRAQQIYQLLSQSVFSLFIYKGHVLKHLLEYLEENTSLDDARQFLDLLFKRELHAIKDLTISDNDRQLQSLQFLTVVVDFPKLTKQLLMNSWAFGKKKLMVLGQYFDNFSIVGKVLAHHGCWTDKKDWENYFCNCDKATLKGRKNCLAMRVYRLIDNFAVLLEKILRKGGDARAELFLYIQQIIVLNLNYEKSNDSMKISCSNPGTLFNLQQALLKVFYPWIDCEDKINTSISKIDLVTLSQLKKHPILSPLYQNIDQLAPELTPLVEATEFSINIDPLTMMFLLIQRINNIMASALGLIYYQLSRYFENAWIILGEGSTEVSRLQSIKAGFDAQFLHPSSIQNTIQFLYFSSKLAMSLLDTQNNPKYPYGLLASSFLNNINTISRIYYDNNEQIIYGDEFQQCCEFYLILMNNKKLLSNTYLRVNGINLFLLYAQPERINRRNLKKKLKRNQLFRNNNIIIMNILPGIIQVFNDSEKTGEDNQFFLKFNLRLSFCKLFSFLLSEYYDIYKELLKTTLEKVKDQFLIFANFYLNDIIFFLDECLNRLKIMKEIETKIWTQEERAKKRIEYQSLKNTVQNYSYFLTEYYNNIQVFSEIQPGAFLTSEIVDKLVNSLNYTLQQLNGPEATQYKCAQLKQTNFDPRLIMRNTIELYINFSKDERFLQQVVKDDRSFSIEIFTKTKQILEKHLLLPYHRIQLFSEIIDKLIHQQEQLDLYESILVDAPEEFLDPLVNTLMTDPVKLPQSQMIVDRLTIKKLILNSPEDPFDRSKLTLEMVIEQPELKQKITTFLEEKKRQIFPKKQKITFEQQ